MYSIIGKVVQFKATPGQSYVPLIDAEQGAEITINKVLLAADGDNVKIGTPVVEGASVTAKVLEHAKANKVLVIKRKRRKYYRRKNGHRQQYTKIDIVSINI